MPVVSAGLSRNYLEHVGCSGASLKDAGFAGAVIDTGSGAFWGIMAHLCRGLDWDVMVLARCSLFACWLVLAVSGFCGCSDCSKF